MDKKEECVGCSITQEQKDSFVELYKELRELTQPDKIAPCPCPAVRCEFHGRCMECVMIHRTYKEHVPACMRPILLDKVKALAEAVECSLVDWGVSPKEKWDYLRETCPPDPFTTPSCSKINRPAEEK